jgi:hypothetical protein
MILCGQQGVAEKNKGHICSSCFKANLKQLRLTTCSSTPNMGQSKSAAAQIDSVHKKPIKTNLQQNGKDSLLQHAE